MGNAARLTAVADVPPESERHLVSVSGTALWLPELTPTDVRRIGVSLLLQAEDRAPAPIDVGMLPYGWTRIAMVVPSLDEADAIDLALNMRRQGRSYQKIADALNALGLTTRSGGPWHGKAVLRLVQAHPYEERERWTVPTVHRSQ